MNLLLISFIFITLGSCQIEVKNYPDCLLALEASHQADISDDFNSKFIYYTSFISSVFIYTTQSQSNPKGISYHIPLNKQGFKTLLMFCGMLFLAVILVCIGRNCARGKQKMRLFIGKKSNSLIGPLLGFVILLLLACLIVEALLLRKIPIFLTNMRCERKEFKGVVINGTMTKNWAGLSGYDKMIEKHSKYLEAIATTPGNLSFQTKPIESRKFQISTFPKQFLRLHENAEIQYQNESVNFTDIIPELLNQQLEGSLIKQLISYHKKLYEVSDLAIKIQQQFIEYKTGLALTSMNALANKYIRYRVLAKRIQDSTIFSDNQQGQLQDNVKNIIFIHKIYLGIAIPTFISYLFLLLLSLKSQTNIVIMLNYCLWVLMNLLIIVPIVALLFTIPLLNPLSYQCETFSLIIDNGTQYTSFFKKNPQRYDQTVKYTIQVMKHCVISPLNTTQFKDFTHFTIQSQPLIVFMNNLQNYTDLMNESNRIYANLYQYDDLYEKIEKYVEGYAYGRAGAWKWLDSVLQTINNITLNNYYLEGCYKHRWVYNQDECHRGETIINTIGYDLFLSQGSYPTAPTLCLPITVKNNIGMRKTLQYIDMLEYYMKDVSLNSSQRCYRTVTNLKDQIISFTNGMKLLGNAMKPILEQFKSERQKLDIFLRIIRSNYLLKKEQYKYLATLSSTIPFDKKSIRDYRQSLKIKNNCTAIRDSIKGIYSTVCIKIRSQLLKMMLMHIFVIMCNAFIIIGSSLFGLNQQMIAKEALFEENEEASKSVTSLKKSKKH